MRKYLIAIIDYGVGNLMSVQNALEYIGAENEITSDKDKILVADQVILPGVGAFDEGMKRLAEASLIETIEEVVKQNKPLLGICLGMQLMFEGSEEGKRPGLGIFKGEIVRFPRNTDLKIPQIGWNNISLVRESRLLHNLDGQYMYFVHSFCLDQDYGEATSVTNYGIDFYGTQERGNVFCTQFHPEKSGRAGLMLLRNFLELK